MCLREKGKCSVTEKGFHRMDVFGTKSPSQSYIIPPSFTAGFKSDSTVCYVLSWFLSRNSVSLYYLGIYLLTFSSTIWPHYLKHSSHRHIMFDCYGCFNKTKLPIIKKLMRIPCSISFLWLPMLKAIFKVEITTLALTLQCCGHAILTKHSLPSQKCV